MGKRNAADKRRDTAAGRTPDGRGRHVYEHFLATEKLCFFRTGGTLVLPVRQANGRHCRPVCRQRHKRQVALEDAARITHFLQFRQIFVLPHTLLAAQAANRCAEVADRIAKRSHGRKPGQAGRRNKQPGQSQHHQPAIHPRPLQVLQAVDVQKRTARHLCR